MTWIISAHHRTQLGYLEELHLLYESAYPSLSKVRGQVSHSYMLCYSLLMASPVSLDFFGAVYHVTARGDWREAIYRAKED